MFSKLKKWRCGILLGLLLPGAANAQLPGPAAKVPTVNQDVFQYKTRQDTTKRKGLRTLEEGMGTFPDLIQGLSFMPPSPSASALAKFIDVPVSHYTGISNVNIPLVSVNEKEIKIDVSLSYHGSGVKVDEAPGWTGQNWALQTGGGIITRTVSGLADESPNGFLNHFAEVQTIANISGTPNMNVYYETLKDFSYGNYDSQPDVFFLSIPGYSVKFYLRPNNTVMTIPYTKLLIKPVISGSDIVSFTVRTPTGLTYNFDKPETSMIGLSPSDPPPAYNSSWYPGSISSPNGYSVTFEYFENQNVSFLANYTRSKRDKISESGTASDEGGSPKGCPFLTVSGGPTGIILANAKKIKKIITSNGYVEFFLSQDRQDTGNIYPIASFEFQDSKLDKIELHDAMGTLVKGFTLQYGYLGPGAGKRLKLSSVTEFGRDLATLPPHTFTYNENEVPLIFDQAQDHWGFRNANSGDYYRIPALTYAGVSYPGQNKESDQNSIYNALGGTLTQIGYPTGGTTTFAYEANREISGSTTRIVGGLRIKEITHTDPVTGSSNKKTYVYNTALLLDIPKYDYTQTVRVYDSRSPYAGVFKTCGYLVRTSKSKNVVGAGTHIVYPHVTEFSSTEAVNGKTDFYYSYPATPVAQDFPFPPQDQYGQIGGNLAETKVSNASDQPLRRKQHFFNDAGSNQSNASAMNGFVIGRNYEWSGPQLIDVNLNNTYGDLFTIKRYDIWSRWLYINKTETTEYAQTDQSKFVKNTTDYLYENPTHAQLTKETSTDSKGNATEKTYTYPHDFAAVMPYSEMITDDVFMISPVIETQQKVAGVNTLYKKKAYEKTSAKYLAKRVSSRIGTGPEVEDLVINDYDLKGNPTEYKERNGMVTKLEFYQKPFSGTTNLGKTDFLKKKTVGVGTGTQQITSYDYLPGAGIQSSIDANGKVTTYEYDNFNRLKTVKNQAGLAVASYCYNYAGQVVDCATINPTGVKSVVPLLLLGEIDAPDLKPQLTITPAIVTNGKVTEFVVDVLEVGGVLPTNGSEITVRVVKSPYFTNFTWNPALTTSSAGISVQNSIWTPSENASYYIFKTSAVIPKSTRRRLVFHLTASVPPGTSAQFAIPVSLVPGSGGELNYLNNASSVVIQIF